MKTLFFFLIFFSSAVVHAQKWTAEKPLEATVVSFDKSCVKLKDSKGHTFEVTRSSLKELKLVSGKTKIQYFLESMKENLCKKP